MFTKEFIKEFPLSIMEIKRVLREKAVKSFIDYEIADSTKDYMIQVAISDHSIIQGLKDNPSIFFSIFDSQSIYINILSFLNTSNEMVFSYSIGSYINNKSSFSSNSRIVAEYYSLKDSFKLLEAKLSAEEGLK